MLFAEDALVIFRRRRFVKQLSQDPVLQPRHGSRAACSLARSSRCRLLVAGQAEARELADHGVAAHSDFTGDFTAREPGREMGFKEFDAFDGPGVVRHLKVPKYEPSLRLPQWPPSCRSVPNAASRGLAVVADRKQPVLDGETNTFLDQGLRNARHAR